MVNQEELLEYLREDASKGIELAIQQYGKAVKTICQSVLSGYSSEDIEEAVSDSFVALWEAREKITLLDGEGLKGYLYGIARNTALNRRRRLAKECLVQNIEETEEIASTEDIESNVINRSEYEVLYQLIASMKSPDKEVFIYRYYYQKLVKEIAELLTLRAKAVENRLARGRSRLKKQLMQSGIEIA